MSTLTVRLSQSANEVPKRKAKKSSLEKVNRMEGEEESSSDLDITKVVRKELDLSQYIDGEWRSSSTT